MSPRQIVGRFRRRNTAHHDYRLGHPWDSTRTRRLWLISVVLYWPAMAVGMTGVVIAQLIVSWTPLLFVAIPALAVFAVAAVLERKANRPVPTISREVGAPPWQVVIIGQVAATAMIVGAVEIVARIPAELVLSDLPNYIRPDAFWPGVVATVFYPAIMAAFVVEAIRQAVDGRWQLAAIHMVQVTLFAWIERQHPELPLLELFWYVALGLGATAGLLRWMSRANSRPVMASVVDIDCQRWRIRGVWSPRYVFVTSDRLTPTMRSTVEAAIGQYRRLRPGWPEEAGREQLVRIAECAHKISKRRRRPGRTKRAETALTDLMTELERLVDAHPRPKNFDTQHQRNIDDVSRGR